MKMCKFIYVLKARILKGQLSNICKEVLLKNKLNGPQSLHTIRTKA